MAANIVGKVCDVFNGHADLKKSREVLLETTRTLTRQYEIALLDVERLKKNLDEIDKDKATLLEEKDQLFFSLEQARTFLDQCRAKKDELTEELNRLTEDESEEAKTLNSTYPKTTLVYEKRYILDEYGKKAYLKLNVQEYVSTRGHLLEVAVALIHRLYSPKTEKQFVAAAWSWIKADAPGLNAAYRSDDYFGTIWNDFWQFAHETLTLLKGDCEDLAILWASLCRVARIPAHRIHVKLGTYNKGGHAWGEYYNPETKKWVLIEATSSHSYGDDLRTPSSMYVAYFAFNDKNTWKIKDGITFGKLVENVGELIE